MTATLIRTTGPVAVDDLPEYPISSVEDLSGHYFLRFDFRVYQGSPFRALASADVRMVAMDLMFAAHDQRPVGTLPVEDQHLAYLARVSLDVWRDLAGRAVPPLYEWQKCRIDTGDIRLYNPALVPITQDSISSRRRILDAREADRERKRLADLPDRILGAGGHKGLAEDRAYILRLDQYLLDRYAGKNRTARVVRAAMEAMDLAGAGP